MYAGDTIAGDDAAVATRLREDLARATRAGESGVLVSLCLEPPSAVFALGLPRCK